MRIVAFVQDDDEELSAGFHTRIWSGQDHRGVPAASGVYLLRLATEGKTLSRKMLLMQ